MGTTNGSSFFVLWVVNSKPLLESMKNGRWRRKLSECSFGNTQTPTTTKTKETQKTYCQTFSLILPKGKFCFSFIASLLLKVLLGDKLKIGFSKLSDTFCGSEKCLLKGNQRQQFNAYWFVWQFGSLWGVSCQTHDISSSNLHIFLWLGLVRCEW